MTEESRQAEAAREVQDLLKLAPGRNQLKFPPEPSR
jgi:hypothetical protein